jgi:hypothetical protein
MSASNTIKYRAVTVADKIAELRSDVIDHVTAMNNADRRTVLASRTAKFLFSLAIEEHTSSGSFDTVNMLAGTVLIPFSPLFGAEDITTLFRKIEENQKSSINQVLSASDTDGAISEIAKTTLEAGLPVEEIWKSSFEKLEADGDEFASLRDVLVQQTLFPELVKPEDDDEVEIPFFGPTVLTLSQLLQYSAVPKTTLHDVVPM